MGRSNSLKILLTLPVLICLTASSILAIEPGLDEYEGRLIESVEMIFEGSPADAGAQADLLSLIRITPNTDFSAVRVRESLQSLFDSGRVANARVEVIENQGNKGPIRIRFVVRRQVQIAEVELDIGPTSGTPIAADELRARLNLVQPGTRLSQQIVNRNADEIQIYLRDRGYFNAVVEAKERVDASGTRATVAYRIDPGEQSRIAAFNLDINGFDPAAVRPLLKLQPEARFTRQALGEDVLLVREAIFKLGYLAPVFEDPRVERDPESNRIVVTLKGAVGPKVNVVVKEYEISEKTALEIFPVKREGNIDLSAIEEGARRLRNKLQEEGYFFAEVTTRCSINPPVQNQDPNGTREVCENLNPQELSGRTIDLIYEVERGRRFRLTAIRIEGTNTLTYEDVAAEC